MTATTVKRARPTSSVSPALSARRAASGAAIQAVPGLGPPAISRSPPAVPSETRSLPRSGNVSETALISARFTPASDATMLGNVPASAKVSFSAFARPLKAAGTGWSAITTRSPPSSSFACRSSAACTRSAKNPTVVTLATAMKSASNNTRSSPPDQLRRSMRIAMKRRFMTGQRGELAGEWNTEAHRGCTEEKPREMGFLGLRARCSLGHEHSHCFPSVHPLCASVSSIGAHYFAGRYMYPPVATFSQLRIMRDKDQRGAALAVHLEEQLDHLLAG